MAYAVNQLQHPVSKDGLKQVNYKAAGHGVAIEVSWPAVQNIYLVQSIHLCKQGLAIAPRDKLFDVNELIVAAMVVHKTKLLTRPSSTITILTLPCSGG